MNMAGLRNAMEQLRVLVAQVTRQGRGSVSALSAAPQQRSVGDKTTLGGGSSGGGGGGSGGTTVEDQTFAMRTLEKKAMKLEAEVQNLTELYHKAVSDAEVMKKNTQKYAIAAKSIGIQSFCRDLVEVADILEMTAVQVSKKGVKDTPETLSKILFEVNGTMQSTLSKHGLRKMTPVGCEYDPYEHHLVCHVPAEGRPIGSVAIVKEDGYKLHDRTIRHARVGVASERC
ncbi:grpE protein homolog 2, mitochondrial-like [Rana temporaria]|uniref:grpE protein homolog 2, mitochondrial-like n=1 Tax=Rana temporaria TaxID=8407 RepID=UPI001AAD1A9D|nr:grpE protein homolog 2, mitochondrial-like [Rana temporaria]